MFSTFFSAEISYALRIFGSFAYVILVVVILVSFSDFELFVFL